MSQKSLSNWLKIMILGVGVCGVLIFVLVLPALGKQLLPLSVDDSLYQIWLVLLGMTALPCYVALMFSWRIVSNIEKDYSFTQENALLLKIISIIATGDALFLFVWNIVLFILEANNLTMLCVFLFVDFLGIVISVIFASLSHLVRKAADLQEQSELTI